MPWKVLAKPGLLEEKVVCSCEGQERLEPCYTSKSGSSQCQWSETLSLLHRHWGLDDPAHKNAGYLCCFYPSNQGPMLQEQYIQSAACPYGHPWELPYIALHKFTDTRFIHPHQSWDKSLTHYISIHEYHNPLVEIPGSFHPVHSFLG